MASHNDLGKRGEEIAANFLTEKGYKILETNWVFKKSEIDIIASKDLQLVFVEVKARSSVVFGLPQNFVNPQKIRHLMLAANAYIEMSNIDFEVRFDIVGIRFFQDKFEIEHLENAFYYF